MEVDQQHPQQQQQDMDDDQDWEEYTEDPAEVVDYAVCKKCDPICLKPFVFEHLLPHADCTLPLARSGHRVVVTDQYLYSFGGFNPDVPRTDPQLSADPIWQVTKPLFQELWRFSLLTRSWSRLKTTGRAPKELASHCAALWDRNTLLVFGGSGMPFGQNSSNKMYCCDLRSLHWSRILYENDTVDDPTDVQLPEPAYGQAMLIDRENDCLYVCGGTNGFDYSLQMHRFDWITKKWSKLSDNPRSIEPRYRHELALYDQKLYIIAGGTSHQSFSMESIPTFDLRTNKWHLETTRPHIDAEGQSHYPIPRYSHASDRRGDYYFIVGGTNELTVLDDCWRLHLPTLTWSRLPCTLPTSLFFHSAAITADGQMLIFGGVQSAERRTRSNAVFSCWVEPPSLATMAKQAMVGVLRRNLDDYIRNGCQVRPHQHEPVPEAAAATAGGPEAAKAPETPRQILNPVKRCEHLSVKLIERNLHRFAIHPDLMFALPEF